MREGYRRFEHLDYMFSEGTRSIYPPIFATSFCAARLSNLTRQAYCCSYSYENSFTVLHRYWPSLKIPRFHSRSAHHVNEYIHHPSFFLIKSRIALSYCIIDNLLLCVLYQKNIKQNVQKVCRRRQRRRRPRKLRTRARDLARCAYKESEREM